MESRTNPELWFLEQWAAEFTNAVRMFTSEEPSITCSAAPAHATGEDARNDFFWWQQKLIFGGSHDIWIGAPQPTWARLGAAMASDSDGGRQIYQEMLVQSLQGAAHVASAGSSPAISCGEGNTGVPPSFSEFEVAEVKIALSGKALPSMLAAVSPSFLRSVAAKLRPAEIAARPAVPNPAAAPALGSMGRLIDLELPMSVALGRAVLPIRDVLRLTSGSLIELNRKLGDSVEIVVHGTVVAKGEVVSVKGNYGVRVREIMSREDRFALRHSEPRASHSGTPN